MYANKALRSRTLRVNKALRPRPLRVDKPLRPRTLRVNKAYLVLYGSAQMYYHR